jgi:hypothetical protein
MEEDISGMTGACVAFAAGFAGLFVGACYFAALRRTVGLYAAGRGRLAAALTVGRFAGAIIFFGLAARQGALPLLSSLLGFLLARALALRAARRAA